MDEHYRCFAVASEVKREYMRLRMFQRDYNIHLAVLNVRYLKGFLATTTRWISATSVWTGVPKASDGVSSSCIAFIGGYTRDVSAAAAQHYQNF